jgi:hypothetical protein
MRPIRVLMILAPATLAACGMIAGLDGYDLAALSSEEAGANGDHADGAFNASADGGASSADASASEDAALPPLQDGGFVRDAGPPTYDAACTATPNGKSCGGDAAACCSAACDESDKCANSCKSAGSCNNDLQTGSQGAIGEGDCCVGLFCNPNSTDVYPFFGDPGQCRSCLLAGQRPPGGTYHSFNDVPIVYDDACCTRQTKQVPGDGGSITVCQ